MTSPDLNATRDGLLRALSGNPKADGTALPGGIIRLVGKTPGDSYLVGLDGNAGSANPERAGGQGSISGKPEPTGVRSIGGAEYFVGIDPGGAGVPTWPPKIFPTMRKRRERLPLLLIPPHGEPVMCGSAPDSGMMLEIGARSPTMM